MHLVTIPGDAIVTLAGEPQQSGLVDVVFQGRVVAMFIQDIQNRGEKILAIAV